MNEEYKTHSAIFDGWELTYYCYNKKAITIEELLDVQEEAYKEAYLNSYYLFHIHESKSIDNIIIGLN